MAKGLFIAFEGGEGSGKSTQAERLCRRMIEERHRVALIHEPGTTTLGKYLRQYLKSKLPLALSSELLLFAAARAQLVAEIIRPSLDKGINIVADRFIGSTIVYQGYGRGIPRNVIDYLNEYVTSGLSPDITVLLDIDPTEALKRVGKPQLQLALDFDAPEGVTRLDVEGHRRFEDQPLSFHNRVRNGYLELAGIFDRWHTLNGELSLDEIEDHIWEILKFKLPAPTESYAASTSQLFQPHE